MKASLQSSVVVAGSHPAIPPSERMAVRLWSIASGLVLIGGVAYAFFGGWYWALIGFAAFMVIAMANRRTAASFVLAAANSDPAFRAEVLRAHVISES